MSQQVQESGNITLINNENSDNVTQLPNNSSLNSQILIIQPPVNNL